VALLAAALALPATSSASASTQACRVPAHAHELAKDGDLYAYKQVSNGGSTVAVSACARPHGRAFGVYSGQRSLTQSLSLQELATAGPILGVDAQTSDQYTEDQLLVVVDVRSRRTLLSASVESWPLGNAAATPGFGGYAIDARGDVAWIESNGGVDRLTLRDSAGRRRTLEVATTITGLAIGGGEVRWLSDGTPRTAMVP